jgi:hypothetical protein
MYGIRADNPVARIVRATGKVKLLTIVSKCRQDDVTLSKAELFHLRNCLFEPDKNRPRNDAVTDI